MSDAFSIKNEGDKTVIELVSILDMSVADELLQHLKESAASQKTICLNGANVQRLSTPCVQIMLAAATDIESKGGCFMVEHASAGFERSMRELGLVDHLKKWSTN